MIYPACRCPRHARIRRYLEWGILFTALCATWAVLFWIFMVAL